MAGRGKTGPPPKLMYNEATLKQIRSLAAIQCTQEEAAAVMDVSLKTFKKFLTKYPKCREEWWIGRRSGTASLRRTQWNQAKHNPLMAKWLGIQYLGQSDRRENIIDVSDDRTVEQIRVGVTRLLESIPVVGTGDRPETIELEGESRQIEELQPISEAEDIS